MSRQLAGTVPLAAVLLAATLPAAAVSPEEEPSPAAEYFTDVVLLDQRGEERRFYSDLLKGRVVVINTFFTSCQGVCPVTMATMQRIQGWLGERLGSEVHLISLTVDPGNDNPARIQTLATSLGARPGWFLLTGERSHVELVLAKLGQQLAQPEDHSPIFFVGNEPTGLWKKALGLAAADELIGIVQSVIEDR